MPNRLELEEISTGRAFQRQQVTCKYGAVSQWLQRVCSDFKFWAFIINRAKRLKSAPNTQCESFSRVKVQEQSSDMRMMKFHRRLNWLRTLTSICYHPSNKLIFTRSLLIAMKPGPVRKSLQNFRKTYCIHLLGSQNFLSPAYLLPYKFCGKKTNPVKRAFANTFCFCEYLSQPYSLNSWSWWETLNNDPNNK